MPSDSFELLLEAMGVGNAVAACKGGVDDLIIDGETAAVFVQNSEQSIYDTLRELLEKRETAKRIAKAAQKYLRENHKVSNMVFSMVRIYREAQEDFLKM
jgi:glycosyltransferase involved in cell wall biosynthesis